MNCSICGKRVVLIPSAAERAKRYGGTAASYTRLFTTHSECAINKRERETIELMRRQVTA